MKHIKYGVRSTCTENGIKVNGSLEEEWFGIDEKGKAKAENCINSYLKMNEMFMEENIQVSYEVSLISREAGNVSIQGTLSVYDNGQPYEEHENYIVITDEEGTINDIELILRDFIGHKAKITIEYMD